MKIATWNVNGIRAREAQLCDWLKRDRRVSSGTEGGIGADSGAV
jgi:hypothetical protein